MAPKGASANCRHRAKRGRTPQGLTAKVSATRRKATGEWRRAPGGNRHRIPSLKKANGGLSCNAIKRNDSASLRSSTPDDLGGRQPIPAVSDLLEASFATHHGWVLTRNADGFEVAGSDRAMLSHQRNRPVSERHRKWLRNKFRWSTPMFLWFFKVFRPQALVTTVTGKPFLSRCTKGYTKAP